ncbi:pyridoxine 5'-phosphate synthase [Puniceicoccaceae bacterium K14]|nr:pyridoxine 5'-phosphate synthase [Puniceicoccaceae bacterium K14]
MSNARILLGVNIDHIATLRQARYREMADNCGKMIEPDPVFLSLLAEKAGADGITVHPREDQRHVQRGDVVRLRSCIQTRLNMEMAATDDMLNFALEVKPDSICIVPENREEVSTEGGLEVAGNYARIERITKEAQAVGIEVSLFIDPVVEQIEASSRIGAEFVELHTGAYANAYYEASERKVEFHRLIEGAKLAHDNGLVVNAGHGINYVNIHEVKHIPHLNELNIGHSIISRSVVYGIDEAVREMVSLMGI